MRRKRIVEIERAMTLGLAPDDGRPFVKRIIPSPPGKQELTVTRRDMTTGEEERRVYVVRHKLASKMDLSQRV